MNAVGYIRRSSRVNAEPGMSWDLQVNAIREMAARYGVDDLELLWDWGRSGGEGKAHLREGWNDLHARLAAGSVSIVFGYASDRMARSLVDLLAFYRACDKAGAKVVYHDGGEQDFRTPEGKMRLEIMGSIGAFQRNQTVEKMKAMHRIRRERGERVGRAPYGSQPGDRADIVVATFREVGSFNGTAMRLNELGLPSPLGGVSPKTGEPRAWRTPSVRAVVAREAPDLIPRKVWRGARTISRTGFAFYHLLRDSRGHTLTASRNGNRIVYHCQYAENDPTHPRPRSVGEGRVREWAMVEAARLRIPADVVETREQDEVQHSQLMGRRERIIEAFIDGTLDKASRDRRLAEVDAALDALAAAAILVDIPPVDWAASPKSLNSTLTALWAYVQLDEAMRPVSAEWLVPEWRA